MNILNKIENYILQKKNKLKISSKDVKNGDVFIALKGKRFHGNKFIDASIQNGAKFIITDNKNFKKNEKILYVRNINIYLKNLAIVKRNKYKGKVIGITGSAGKTTLKETLAFFLKKNYLISFSIKSYNNELGVLISLLNLDLKSEFSIFEIGTNNFGEIKYLTSLIKPSEIFITNIQSTHLQNFKSKNNIAKEKSDIFLLKYNNQRKKLYLNITSKEEKILINKAIKEKKLKVIRIDKYSKNYFIKKILPYKNYYSVFFYINRKIVVLNFSTLIEFRLNNLLFCFAFFCENSLKIKTISEQFKYLKPVNGRGLIHKINFYKKKLSIIDESYNANPDTMLQSINYFQNIKKPNNKKILVLGNMNELGDKSINLHFNLLQKLDKHIFKFVILSGEFFKISIKKLNKPKNEYIYIQNNKEIMNYLKKYAHNNDIILIKCSNATEINKFTNILLKR